MANAIRLGLGVVSTVSVAVFTWSEGVIAILLVYALLILAGVVMVALVSDRDSRGDVSRLFLSIYAFNVILAILFYLALMARYRTPYLFGGTDDRVIDLSSRAIAGRIGWFDYAKVRALAPPAKYYGYRYVVTVLHKLGGVLGGSHTMIPRLFNCFVGACIAVLLLFVARICDYRLTTARRAAYLAGVYPLMSFHAAVILRDDIVGFLTLYVLYAALKICFLRGHMWVNLLGVLGATAALWEFRESSVLAVLAATVVALLYSWRLRRRKRISLLVGGLIVLIVLAALAWNLEADWAESRAITQVQRARQKYELHGQERAAADSLGMRLIGLPVPLNYLFRLGYALIEPLPVLTSDLTRLWKSVGAVFWYSLLPFFLMGLPSQLRSARKSILVIVSVTLFVGLAFTTLHDRHMVHYAPMFILIAVDGFERFPQYRSRVWLLAIYLAIWTICAYLMLKFVVVF